jgi:hypothetical protein
MSYWLQLCNAGRVDNIFTMLAHPEWLVLTVLSLLSTLLIARRNFSYCWAYFIGFWSLYAGSLLMVIPVGALAGLPLHGLPGSENWGTAGILLASAFLMVQGTLILQQTFWVFALLALSCIHPFLFLANAAYVICLLHKRHAFI